MNWDARSETIFSLRTIFKHHPGRIRFYEEKYSEVKESRRFETLMKKEEHMRNYKRMIELYKKQLYLATIELILRGRYKT